MLQSLPNERAKCFTYESLRSTSIFFLGMWAHLGRFFLDQDWLYSFTQKSEYPISLMQPGIHRRKTKSADCSPDRAGTWATSLALRVTWMKDRRKIACQWFDISYYGGCCSSIFCCKGWIAASLIHFQGWRSPTCCCRDDARPATMKEGSIWSPCEPVLHAHCRSVAVDHRVLMCTCTSPFAANWLNLPFSIWSLLH